MRSRTRAVPASVDVCVVGGSIAGATTALALRNIGLSVAIVEREPAFRDKARGEGIHPWGIDEADDLGIHDLLDAAGANPLPTWLTYTVRRPLDPFNWADQSARGNVEHGVFHPRLQETLLAAAADSGAIVLRPATMMSIAPNGDENAVVVSLAGEHATLTARIVIGADGTRSKTRSENGIRSHRDRQHHWFAGLLVDRFRGDDSAAHAGLLPGGRFFVLPQGQGKARVYAGQMPDRAGTLRADRSGTSLIALVGAHLPERLLADAVPAGPQGIFNNADLWPEDVISGTVVLVGDSAGTNDPTIGHGISLTLRDVRELRDAIVEHGVGRTAFSQYATRRKAYYRTLRAYAKWMAELWIEEGPASDDRRELFRTARESDPDAGGFNMITALGPRSLTPDAAARARFFGESAGSGI